MTETSQLEALRAEVDALREELSNLRQAITDARGRVKHSMRDRVRCPDCGGGRIAHFDSVPDFGYGQVFDAGLAVKDRGPWRTKLTEAKLEAYVCTGCGLVEWWVGDTTIFASDDGRFRILTSDVPGDGPFR